MAAERFRAGAAISRNVGVAGLHFSPLRSGIVFQCILQMFATNAPPWTSAPRPLTPSSIRLKACFGIKVALSETGPPLAVSRSLLTLRLQPLEGRRRRQSVARLEGVKASYRQLFQVLWGGDCKSRLRSLVGTFSSCGGFTVRFARFRPIGSERGSALRAHRGGTLGACAFPYHWARLSSARHLFSGSSRSTTFTKATETSCPPSG